MVMLGRRWTRPMAASLLRFLSLYVVSFRRSCIYDGRKEKGWHWLDALICWNSEGLIEYWKKGGKLRDATAANTDSGRKRQ